jgi:dipeptidyl aminopeptidase/acylaminoacyl peptidase
MSGRAIICAGLLLLSLFGCRSEAESERLARTHKLHYVTPKPAATSPATPYPTPPGTPTPAPALVPASDDPSPTPLSPDDPFAGLRMDDLAAREYGGSGIGIDEVVKAEKYFVQYAMHYESDGLKITGLIDIPVSGGPFPVVIVNHGYLRPVEYKPGFDSWHIADWLAQQEYITIMPDYRHYGGSDSGPNPFRIGYAIDVMNLIAQVDTLPQASPEQIGIIGHSMGGEISMWPMILSDEVDAVVLYSSMSGDVARNWEHRWRYWPFQREAMEATALVYGTPEDSPEGYADISPINYLDRVRMPVMIHHGTMDETVPYWWSEELWHLMEDAGVDVTFWPYPDAGHTLGGRGFETFMQRNLAFFDEHVRGNVNSP